MKTYKSTLNRFLFVGLLVIVATLIALHLKPLEPFRISVANTLGLPVDALWMLAGFLCLGTLALLASKLHGTMTAPIKDLSDQCSNGQISDEEVRARTREARIIRDYLRQVQSRADQRAEQNQRMEEDLLQTRKERDRSFRKIEEFEDLMSSYNRIRKELDIDNSNLRIEKRKLEQKVEKLESELSELKRNQRILDTPALEELRSATQDTRELSEELVRTWDQRAIGALRSAILSLAQKCAAQVDLLESAVALENQDGKLIDIPTPQSLQRLLETERSDSLDIYYSEEWKLVEDRQDTSLASFLKDFTRLASENIGQGRLDLRAANGSDSRNASVKLDLISNQAIGNNLNRDAVEGLAQRYGVVTGGFEASEKELHLSLPLNQLQAR